MESPARLISRSFDRGERLRLATFFAIVAAMHIAGWGMLLVAAASYPTLLGLGALAYSFGLRHAFDADHISAIDNTTRKLLQQQRRPMGVGFFFSLGHSSVVFLISLLLGFAVKSVVEGVVDKGGTLKVVGSTVGTSVSGLFLLLIGLLNLVILLDILATYARLKRGEYDHSALERELVSGGVLTRLFSRLFRLVSESWHMYPIGFLFGLGFDTASEVALLAVSAGAASQGLPFVAILSLPLIFAAGMSLMDTADGAFMVKAYSWAFSSPVRKLFYNMTMTALSVVVALFVGGVELFGLLIQKLGLEGGLFDAIAGLDFSSMGFIIVGGFVVSWALAFTLFKVRRVEERWAAMLERSEPSRSG